MSFSSIGVPAAVLCVFGFALPLSLPHATSDGGGECLTFADSPPVPQPNLASTLERCSALYPDDAELLADLGREYERSGATQRAEQAYRRVLDLDPGYADIRLQLGRLLLTRGASGEARHQAEAALAVQPNRRALLDLLEQASRLEAVK